MNTQHILVLDAAPVAPYTRVLLALVRTTASGEEILYEDIHHDKRAAENLPFLMARMLETSNVPIDKLAVIIGPGSFTGLRASCAAAQGFAFARNIPCIGLLRGDVLGPVLNAQIKHKQQDLQGWLLLSQARRGQVFVEDKQKLVQYGQEELTVHYSAHAFLLAGELRREFPNLGPVSDIAAPTSAQIARAAYQNIRNRDPVPAYVEAPRVRKK